MSKNFARHTKADVQTSYHGSISSNLPMVNVKVYSGLYGDEAQRLAEQVEADNGFVGFAAWYEKVAADDKVPDWFFGAACEAEYEQFVYEQTDADMAAPENVNGKGQRVQVFPEYTLKMWTEGRQGGWLVVDGLPSMDEWDAVMVGRWFRFAKEARTYADNVPYVMLDLLAGNLYEPLLEEWQRAEERANIIAADAMAALIG